MPKQAYITKNFRPASLDLIEKANTIIDEYTGQGLILTLRQLYYQFVSRDWIPNTPKSYDNLGAVINDGRLAGMIDWTAIEDRTRNLQSNSHWTSPQNIIEACESSYMRDRWDGQPKRVEVWIEKEALAGVLEGPCGDLDVPFFACRGYTSQSEVWRASKRLLKHIRNNQQPVIIHLGDHDPSGIDMTRDIMDRLRLFLGDDAGELEVVRIALNMNQVEQYNPPPNPAKTTDSRFADYQAKFGDESWELDALNPTTLVGLVRAEVAKHCNKKKMKATQAQEKEEKQQLAKCAERWTEVSEYLEA